MVSRLKCFVWYRRSLIAVEIGRKLFTYNGAKWKQNETLKKILLTTAANNGHILKCALWNEEAMMQHPRGPGSISPFQMMSIKYTTRVTRVYISNIKPIQICIEYILIFFLLLFNIQFQSIRWIFELKFFWKCLAGMLIMGKAFFSLQEPFPLKSFTKTHQILTNFFNPHIDSMAHFNFGDLKSFRFCPMLKNIPLNFDKCLPTIHLLIHSFRLSYNRIWWRWWLTTGIHNNWSIIKYLSDYRL